MTNQLPVSSELFIYLRNADPFDLSNISCVDASRSGGPETWDH